MKNYFIKNRKGATIILAIGISTLLLLFSVGIGKIVQNSSKNIRDFKNKWQAGLIADSIKEQLMLDSKGEGAGYNLEQIDCSSQLTGVSPGSTAGKIKDIYQNINPEHKTQKDAICAANPGAPGCTDDTTQDLPAGLVNFKCSVKGKNDVEVKDATSPIKCDGTDPTKCYTIPTANTGNASMECNDKYPITSLDNLKKWIGMAFPGGNANDLALNIFGNDPLRHPCNWNRLKFGTDMGKKVAVPLYYTERSGGIEQLGADDKLYIRVRTPCKPIKIRPIVTGVDCDNPSPSSDNIANCCINPANKDNPECKYKDVCSDWNRYKLDDTGCSGTLGIANCTTVQQKDKTLLVWQISGECVVAGTDPGVVQKQPCALIHNQEIDALLRAEQNSEISESKINEYNIDSSIIKMDGAASSYGTLTGKKVPGNTTCRIMQGTNQPSISEFLNPSLYSPKCDEFTYPYSSISSPTLQLAITEAEIKDGDTPPNRIPYLEYQIVTNKPIANPLEIFSADVNFQGQNFKLTESIEQIKNIIDFAVQN